ncbi:hypothetical protein [Spirosoma fluviale]|uniref:WG containing repeat-containing protein n=1 Tax=Spirosoma fluviale TaxID=1597977 RepID=A0A286GVY8_9BACT|nr:hypothetical protein [Spirosoma fluviale]SOD99693.1 hypothetical protein SAMN06269250_0114 [Spirosoma fluviale]
MKTCYTSLVAGLLCLTTQLLPAQQTPVQFNYAGSRIQRAPNAKVECGDQIKITATGEVIVGMLAGKRTPVGVPEYSGNQYNTFRNLPHGALMVCVLEEGAEFNLSNYAYLGWELCGSSYTFTAKKSGFLLFDINDDLNWRWDNKPVGNGFQVSITLPSRTKTPGDPNSKTVIGELADSKVYRLGNKVSYDCKLYDRKPDGWWEITDKDGKPLGLCSDKEPYVYTYIGKNEQAKTDNDVYADVETQKYVVYRRKKVEISQIDKRWYLQDNRGACEGIVDLENGQFSVRETSDRLTEILKHLNRNQFNQEAKGQLTYLCSRRVKLIGKHRYYVDQSGCVWTLLLERESVYHLNPDPPHQIAFKLVRMASGGASFETVRVPANDESRTSLYIIGNNRAYQLNGRTFYSVNLRDTEGRGSYNYANSTYGSVNFSSHYWEDMADHSSFFGKDYKDYMVFPERFGTPNTSETAFIQQIRSIPMDYENERSCPVSNNGTNGFNYP